MLLTSEHVTQILRKMDDKPKIGRSFCKFEETLCCAPYVNIYSKYFFWEPIFRDNLRSQTLPKIMVI